MANNKHATHAEQIKQGWGFPIPSFRAQHSNTVTPVNDLLLNHTRKKKRGSVNFPRFIVTTFLRRHQFTPWGKTTLKTILPVTEVNDGQTDIAFISLNKAEKATQKEVTIER